jgi:hypothetical protein
MEMPMNKIFAVILATSLGLSLTAAAESVTVCQFPENHLKLTRLVVGKTWVTEYCKADPFFDDVPADQKEISCGTYKILNQSDNSFDLVSTAVIDHYFSVEDRTVHASLVVAPGKGNSHYLAEAEGNYALDCSSQDSDSLK